MHTHRENIKTTVKGCSIPLELRYQLAEAKPPTFLFWLLGFNLGPHPSMLNFTHWELPVMDFSLQCPGFTFTHSLLPPDIFLSPFSTFLYFLPFWTLIPLLSSSSLEVTPHTSLGTPREEKAKCVTCPQVSPLWTHQLWRWHKVPHQHQHNLLIFYRMRKKTLNLRLTTQQMLFSLSSPSTEKQTWRPICISRNKSIKWA